ncbi:MAG: hypothetical protein WBG90_05150 [Saonia sp.]
MGINTKIIQFVDYLGVSQRKFTSKCGLSEGSLRGGKSVSVESLQKIKRTYPEFNVDWALFDKGEMILGRDQLNEEGADYGNVISIDDIVDIKIEEKLSDIKEALTEFLANEIQKELDAITEKKKTP